MKTHPNMDSSAFNDDDAADQIAASKTTPLHSINDSSFELEANEEQEIVASLQSLPCIYSGIACFHCHAFAEPEAS